MRIKPHIYLTILFLTILVGSSIPLLLYTSTDSPNKRKNGFIRFIKDKLKVSHSIVRPSNIYRISGLKGKSIFFAHKLPGKIIQWDTSSNLFSLDSIKGIAFPNYHIPYDMQITNNCIFEFIGDYKKVYKANFSSLKVTDSLTSSFVFTRGAVISNQSISLRQLAPAKLSDQTLSIRIFNSDLQYNSILTSFKQDVSGIETDGLLLYDTNSKTIIYSPFYSSQIICLDSSLNTSYKIHTIDTITQIRTKSGSAPLGNTHSQSISISSPRYLITKHSCTFNGKVYLLAALKADNELFDDFINNATVDVYDLKERKYLYSFYIPLFNGERTSQFSVFDKTLIALYKSSIVVYNLKT